MVLHLNFHLILIFSIAKYITVEAAGKCRFSVLIMSENVVDCVDVPFVFVFEFGFR